MAGAAVADAQVALGHLPQPGRPAGRPGSELELGGALVLPDVAYFRRPVTDPVNGQTVQFAEAANSNRAGGVPFLARALRPRPPRPGAGLRAPSSRSAPPWISPATAPSASWSPSVSLRTVYLGPALAWQATSRLSLGLSVSYVYADFALGQRNALQFVTGDPEANPNPDRGVEGDTRIEARDPFSLARHRRPAIRAARTSRSPWAWR